MDKAQLQKGIVVVLLLAFAWTFGGALRSGGRRPVAPPVSQVAAPNQTMPMLPDAIKKYHAQYETPEGRENDELLPAPPPETVAYTAGSLRNPMVSLLPKPVEEPAPAETASANAPAETLRRPPTVQVQGIIWGSSRPQALIDGSLYEVGDTVAGAKIVSIDRAGVTVGIGRTTFTLKPTADMNTMAGMQ